MASLRSRLLKPVALTLVICVMQVYVMANPSASVKSAAPNIALGQLILPGNQTMLVNGNSATSGTTIFSGSLLQTLDGVAANVQLGEAGRLLIEPNTSLTVTFDNSNVDVRVAKGNAFLSTSAGVKGSITAPNGMTMTSASTASSLPPAPSGGRRRGAFIGGAALIALIIAAILITNDDDDDDSP